MSHNWYNNFINKVFENVILCLIKWNVQCFRLISSCLWKWFAVFIPFINKTSGTIKKFSLSMHAKADNLQGQGENHTTMQIFQIYKQYQKCISKGKNVLWSLFSCPPLFFFLWIFIIIDLALVLHALMFIAHFLC